ncbi:MAG: hypothetical protein CMJ58_06155 [Planctomycetaceae bacterium]|nr:hypothetical protein [Planctomycetaceae bacterium]
MPAGVDTRQDTATRIASHTHGGDLVRRLTTCASALAVIAAAADASAVVTSFDDRALWESTVGPRTFDEDFEAIPADIDYSFTTTSAPNGFVIEHRGGDDFRNLIDVTPLDYADGNGTNGVSAYVDGETGDEVWLTPDAPLTALGLNVSSAATGEGATITLIGPLGAVLTNLVLPGGIDAFVGFQTPASEPILDIQFAGNGGVSGGEGFYLDNIGGIVIPEPAAMALACVGVIALMQLHRCG